MGVENGPFYKIKSVSIHCSLALSCWFIGFGPTIFRCLEEEPSFRKILDPQGPFLQRGVLVGDPSEIAKRYMTSYFLIDILAVLPLPQVVILLLIPKLRGPPPLHAIKLLRFVLFQYILRFIQIIRLYREDRRSYGILTRNAWSGAALTLYFYMLASNV